MRSPPPPRSRCTPGRCCPTTSTSRGPRRRAPGCTWAIARCCVPPGCTTRSWPTTRSTRTRRSSLARDLLRQGRRHDAIQALDRMAEVFERELGVEPPEAARQLRAEAEAMPAAGSRPGPPAYASSGATASRSRRVPFPLRATAWSAGSATSTRWPSCWRAPGGHDHRAGWSRQVDAGAGARADACSPTTAFGAADVRLRGARAGPRARTRSRRAVAEAVGVQGEAAVRTSALAATLGPHGRCCSSSTTASTCWTRARPSSTRSSTPATEARVLVTSREPLRVDGEAVHALGSLGPGAVELFVERAKAAAGDGRRGGRRPAGRRCCASGSTGCRWPSSWPPRSCGT